jgi:glyoxylase-like metal-dependent hydrolase (beta-lactamase superfamily II)
VCLLAALPFLLVTPLLSAEDVTVRRITDRVVVVSSDPWATNVVAVKTAQGIVVIDTHISPSIARRCRAAIEKTFGEGKLAYVVNTHFHLDHAGGNLAFADATIVGHDNTRPLQEQKEMADWAKAALEQGRKKLGEVGTASEEGKRIARGNALWAEVVADYEKPGIAVPPTLTFDDRMTLHLGDVTLRLIYFGRAHSTSDIFVYLPEQKVLVAAALVAPGQLAGGHTTDEWDVPQWLAAYDAVLAGGAAPAYVVPGHGEVMTGAELVCGREYLGKLWAAVTEMQGRGATLEQAKGELALERRFPEYGDLRQKNWAGQDVHTRNLEGFWRCAERLAHR